MWDIRACGMRVYIIYIYIFPWVCVDKRKIVFTLSTMCEIYFLSSVGSPRKLFILFILLKKRYGNIKQNERENINKKNVS